MENSDSRSWVKYRVAKLSRTWSEGSGVPAAPSPPKDFWRFPRGEQKLTWASGCAIHAVLVNFVPEEVSVRDGVGKREKGYNHKESSIVLPIVSAKKKFKRQEVINLKSRLEKEKNGYSPTKTAPKKHSKKGYWAQGSVYIEIVHSITIWTWL